MPLTTERRNKRSTEGENNATIVYRGAVIPAALSPRGRVREFFCSIRSSSLDLATRSKRVIEPLFGALRVGRAGQIGDGGPLVSPDPARNGLAARAMCRARGRRLWCRPAVIDVDQDRPIRVDVFDHDLRDEGIAADARRPACRRRREPAARPGSSRRPLNGLSRLNQCTGRQWARRYDGEVPEKPR